MGTRGREIVGMNVDELLDLLYNSKTTGKI